MFNKDRVIADCMIAVSGGQEAIREIVAEAVSDGTGVMSELGAPEHAGITPLYRSCVWRRFLCSRRTEASI